MLRCRRRPFTRGSPAGVDAEARGGDHGRKLKVGEAARVPAGSGHEASARSLRELLSCAGNGGLGFLPFLRSRMIIGFGPRESIQISVIGDSSKIPNSFQKLISDAEERTKDNFGLQLIVAVSYSGKYDVVQACKSISQKVKDGLVQVDDINESLIEQELKTNCTEFPYPDLLVRTSGELRLSNFLLWQLAYTELFFVSALWPDFGKAEFVEALISFQQRQRHYGGRDF